MVGDVVGRRGRAEQRGGNFRMFQVRFQVALRNNEMSHLIQIFRVKNKDVSQ